MLDRIREGIKKFVSKLFIDEAAINELVREIQRALLLADVDLHVVRELSQRLKERLKQASKDEALRIVYEEIVNIVGEGKQISITPPFRILLVGLFGSGKTTTAAKLAKFWQKRGYKVALLGLDTFRPAAPDQLLQLGQKIGVPVFIDKSQKDPVAIIRKFEDELKKFDIIIADSSGRDALNEEMKQEIIAIKEAFKPNLTLLVFSADIGQNARLQAEAFNQAVGIDGVIITKMDGSAKGGGALVACKIANAPIYFIGVGEHLDDIEEFDAPGFVSRLLGMGDIKALIKKAEEIKPEVEDLEEKFLAGKFNLLDLYKQLEAMSKMGPLSKIMQLIPGAALLPKEMLNVQQEKLKRFKVIMDSMTKEELENPEIINASRMQRIAKGAGVSVADVKELLNYYKQMKLMIKRLNMRDLRKLAKRFGLS